MEIQHLNLKVYAADPAAVKLPDFIGIFNTWIQRKVTPELLIDVADYGHVPNGPGVLLIAHEAHYSLDISDGRPGLLYSRKARIEGSTQSKLHQALQAALQAARRLEDENGLAFQGGEVQVVVNDRLLAPNTPETVATLTPELEAFFAPLYGADGFTLNHRTEPRALFTVNVVANTQPSVAELLSKLPEPAHA